MSNRSVLVLQRRKAPYSAKAGTRIPIQIQGKTVWACVAEDLQSQAQDVEVVATGIELRLVRGGKRKSHE